MSMPTLLERSSSVACFPSQASAPAGAPAAANWCVVPRCEMRFEKCDGGFKIHCRCEDEVACGTIQNLCRMLADGTCCCTVTCNGQTLCCCYLTMGRCVCTATKDGCTISCLSGDEQCCAMAQACCDCLSCCCEAGCTCTISFGGTPVCCGTC